MSNIFIIIGKSSTGKDTIFKKLTEIPELALRTVVPYTTRPIRQSEEDGVEYFFVNQEKLDRLMEEGLVIEKRDYKTIHGIWSYFTVNDGQISLGEGNYILIGTLEAYQQIRDYYGEKYVHPIYIEVEDELRLRRALNREAKQEQPKYAEMCRRYLADEEDFSEEKIIACNITKRYQNIYLKECIEEISVDIKDYTQFPQ